MSMNDTNIEDVAEDAVGAENVSDFQAQLAAVRAELAAMATTLSAMSRTGKENAKQAASEYYADLKAKGTATLDAASMQAEEKLDGVAEYAREKPLKALTIAAGIGMLLGLLLGRR